MQQVNFIINNFFDCVVLCLICYKLHTISICRYGYLDCLQALLTEGECPPNLTNQTGSSPLHLAARKGKVYVVELLLSHSDINVVSDTRNHFSRMMYLPSKCWVKNSTNPK